MKTLVATLAFAISLSLLGGCASSSGEPFLLLAMFPGFLQNVGSGPTVDIRKEANAHAFSSWLFYPGVFPASQDPHSMAQLIGNSPAASNVPGMTGYSLARIFQGISQGDQLACYIKGIEKTVGVGDLTDGQYRFAKIPISSTSIAFRFQVTMNGTTVAGWNLQACALGTQIQAVRYTISGATVSGSMTTYTTNASAAPLAFTATVTGPTATGSWNSKHLTLHGQWNNLLTASPTPNAYDIATIDQVNDSILKINQITYFGTGTPYRQYLAEARLATADTLNNAVLQGGNAYYYDSTLGGSPVSAAWNGDWTPLTPASSSPFFADTDSGTLQPFVDIHSTTIAFSAADTWNCALPATGALDLSAAVNTNRVLIAATALCDHGYGF